MMETPLFLKNKNYNLLGVIHEPEPKKPNEPKKQTTGIVFCHPFAEEKLIAHRVMVNLARRLTKEGLYCFRFDYMGHGDSDGNFEDSTIETRLSDIQCAIEFLRKQTDVKRVGLLGVRLGATLAALTCNNISEIDSLILISPIVEGKPYIDQCLRSNLTTQMSTYKKIIKDRKQLISDLMADQTVNIDGYLVTKALYQQIETINLLTKPLGAPPNVLILRVSKKENQPIEDEIAKLYMKYRDQYDSAKLLNVKEDLFWTDTKIYNPQAKNVQESVVNWLSEVYSS
jgi:exosortase A-associated hydrolase 2